MSGARRRGLATRILLAQAAVLLVSVASAAVVAMLAGPPIFAAHLRESGNGPDSAEFTHMELAYRDASFVSLTVALLASAACALVVTWLLTRRLGHQLAELADAASELSHGRYDRRVAASGTGDELDTVAASFNTLAGRLGDVEATRRRLLSDLAHELRTPVATLQAHHEGLSDGVIDPAPEVYSVLAEQTARLTRLADDMREVSLAEEGRLDLHLRPEPVADLLRDAADALRHRFDAKGVDLIVEAVGPDTALTVVLVDRRRIGQVLANLLGNALRHTPEGGHVTLTCAVTGDGVEIRVADDGEGIPAGQLPHVFERFYRGDQARDRDRSGSGIGLTISRAIVEAHGGGLVARSEGTGRGATLVLTLPPGSA